MAPAHPATKLIGPYGKSSKLNPPSGRPRYVRTIANKKQTAARANWWGYMRSTASPDAKRKGPGSAARPLSILSDDAGFCHETPPALPLPRGPRFDLGVIDVPGL